MIHIDEKMPKNSAKVMLTDQYDHTVEIYLDLDFPCSERNKRKKVELFDLLRKYEREKDTDARLNNLYNVESFFLSNYTSALDRAVQKHDYWEDFETDYHECALDFDHNVSI